MPFPTRKASLKAKAEAQAVMADYLQRRGGPAEGWNADDAIVSAVFGRQDLILIHVILTACHEQLVKISRGVWFVALCVVMLTFTNCMIATK